MILSVALPVLVMVTVLGELTVPTFWFEKLRLVGETVTAVLWTAETYDNGGLHDTSANKDRFTAPAAGLYHFDAYFYFAANVTGARNVQAIKNGTAGAASFIFNSEMTADYSGVGRIMELHFQMQLERFLVQHKIFLIHEQSHHLK